MRRRRLLALAAVGAALGILVYTATSLVGAPVNLAPPRITATPWPAEKLELVSPRRAWRTARSASFKLRYSWLRCDLKGAQCVALAGLHSRQIVPPQELRLVTIRGLVTATNPGGSTTVVSRNFYFDDATRPRAHRSDIDPLIYDPAQLRHWYGLRPSQNGRGQTIVLGEERDLPRLRFEVAQFSAQFDLPLPCGSASTPRSCFHLRIARAPYLRPADQGWEDEAALDVEWAHAVAPRAAIVVVDGNRAAQIIHWFGWAARSGRAHVFSMSFSWPPPDLTTQAERHYVRQLQTDLAGACGRTGIVCLESSGDHGPPGDAPANSPDVLAVGGTVFRSETDGVTRAEKAWPRSGGGATALPEPKPPWQRVQCRDRVSGTCSGRQTPDVSATAGGVPQFTVLTGRRAKTGWFQGGGTSLSSPLWAALVAIADEQLARRSKPPIGIDELHAVLYRGWLSAGLDNLGHHGWNRRTGWGAPKAGIVDVLVKAIERYRTQH